MELSGTVSTLVRDRNFGFILDEKGAEYFFHSSAAKEFKAIEAGDQVTFKPMSTEKGLRAVGVKRV